MIGEAGLTTALHEAGYIMTETDPDYVVISETRQYSFEAITKAIRLINDGARFIITNPDATGPTPLVWSRRRVRSRRSSRRQPARNPTSWASRTR